MINRNRWVSFRSRSVAVRTALMLGVAVFAASCSTSTQRDSRSSSYLIIESLTAASGAQPGEVAGVLASDVSTLVSVGFDSDGNELFAATVYADPASVIFSLGMRDPGVVPTPTNSITITRYRVDFVRSDGRNTPGVDVPYGFDGAVTASVNDEGGGSASFELVRLQSKLEAPLRALVNLGGALAISTIAEVTFYGQDQAGREVSVTGKIGVTFADWADPE